MIFLRACIATVLFISVSAQVRNINILSTDLNTRASNLEDYLLPKDIIPEHYDIKLIPYLDDNNFTFDGEVTISVRVQSNTNIIKIHQNDTIINEESVTITNVNDNTTATITNQRYEALYHFHIIELAEPLVQNQVYTIYIKYRGYLRDDMQGLFRSSYKTSTGETRWLAATHFQPCRARRAFPSFDEPALKATFKVSIARTPDRHALWNMPVVEISDPDPELNGMIWDHFDETLMPLSTYLLAFIVSDFTSLSDGDLTMWQRAEAMEQARYSVSIGLKTLQALERYTGLHYFLPKMDEVAVPDYQSGATEQWGLVTYRERLILFVDGVSTSSHKQAIATVIAHEFTHMWFGNLVSPKWWNVLWLNEGFASYYEFFSLAEVETDWRLEEQFVIGDVHSSLSVDSVNTSHPMTVDVADPAEISSIFDTISYSKAASVIHMMKHIITPEIFRRGINRYLTNVGNRSADADDLFLALNDQYVEEVENPQFDVKTVMDTWTLQMGYPVIKVTRNNDTGTVTVSQERFLIRPAVNPTDTHDYKWWVPLTYTRQGNINFGDTTTKQWLKSTEAQATLNNVQLDNDEWIIFNILETGFYRVNYDDHNWNLIAEYLKGPNYGRIAPLNRAKILDDLFNLARAGQVSYRIAFNVFLYLKQETDYIPWQTAMSGFTYIEKRLRGDTEENYNLFKKFLLELLDKVYNELGFDERNTDGHITKLHRNLILTWACNLGETYCISNATSKFTEFFNDPHGKSIAPDLKTVVYCNGLRANGEAQWNFLWQRFLDYHNVSTEQTLILGILGCTRNEALAHRYMDYSLDRTSEIRAQDLSLVFPSVYNSHEVGVNFAINYLHINFREIAEFHNTNNAISSFVSSLSSVCTTEEQVLRLRNFIDTNAAVIGSGVASAARNSLQTAERNLEWLRTHGKTIIDYIIEINASSKIFAHSLHLLLLSLFLCYKTMA